MKSSDLTGKTVAFIRELFHDDAGGHDADHTMRVYRNAIRIAETEPECDRELVGIAALLHDADDHKLFSAEDNFNARRFLTEHGVVSERVEKICRIINTVSYSQNGDRCPDTIEGKVVQDADRLDAMGAIGVARTFAYGGEHGRPMRESVQHFYDKLLRLHELMNTEEGKKLAKKRHAFLETFLAEYKEEMQDK